MTTNDISKLVTNRDLASINTWLGPVAPFFWITYANYAIEGVPVTKAVEQTFRVVKAYLDGDALGILHRETRAAA